MFSKPPLSIEAQLAKLTGRGLIVSNPKEAAERLASIGYYRLSGYALAFQDCATEDKPFKSGTTWDDLIGLYTFDRELRGMIAEALERIETSFRTTLNLHMCLTYGAHWYMDGMHFDPSFKHDSFLRHIETEMHIPENGKTPEKVHAEVFINHYYKKYGDPYLPPCWMICEVLSLGRWSVVYENLQRSSDRQAIADAFGYDQRLFGQWMRSLTYVRNICAHHLRLWNRKLVIKSPIPRKHSAIIPTDSGDRVFSVIVVLFDWLKLKEPKTQWHFRLADILESHSSVKLKDMGFPALWRQNDFWGFPKS
jgi:abortive infection bacteriophage resistance protein